MQCSGALVAPHDDFQQRTISEGVVELGTRQRNARVQILQDNLDSMRRIIAARAFQYSADMAGATGLMMKDYRGKNSEKEIRRFDAALVSQMNEVLKQAAIEEGQRAEKRESRARCRWQRPRPG